jgi:hypothetical protein
MGLEELLKNVPKGEFKPYAYQSDRSLFVYFKGDADYSESLTDEITLYKSLETNEIVGCAVNLKSIKKENDER